MLKKIWAALASFIIYIFPIPTLHANLIWGQMLWETLSNNYLISPVGRIFFAIFAIAYQIFSAFCFYQVFKNKPSKLLIFSLPLIILLYLGLIIGSYIIAFLVFIIEQKLGIARV